MPRLSKEKHIEICSRYQQGENGTVLAKEFQVSEPAVYGLLRRRNILIRDSVDSRKKLACDYTYFSEINTEEKAYWLGFLAADGAISRNSQLMVALASIDRSHILKLKKALKSEHAVTDYKMKGKEYSCISFHSVQLIQDLSKYGVTRRKTFTLSAPKNIDYELLKHYYRGYVDGDGGFYVPSTFSSKTQVSVYFSVTSCKEFIEGFQQYLIKECNLRKTKFYKRNPDSEIYTMTYSGTRQVKKITDLLYSFPSIYLDRKYEKVKSLPLPTRKQYVYNY